MTDHRCGLQESSPGEQANRKLRLASTTQIGKAENSRYHELAKPFSQNLQLASPLLPIELNCPEDRLLDLGFVGLALNKAQEFFRVPKQVPGFFSSKPFLPEKFPYPINRPGKKRALVLTFRGEVRRGLLLAWIASDKAFSMADHLLAGYQPYLRDAA